MSRIHLHDKTFETYIESKKIVDICARVGAEITKDFKDSGEIPVAICVLNGSIMFMGELMKHLDIDCEFASLRMASYEGTRSTGEVKELLGLTTDIKGRSVIVVEDIVDTGNTIVAICNELEAKGAKEVKVCTLFLKPDVYDKDRKIDYVGMEIENKFIVGFGLDYDQLGRNYPDIYILC